MAHTPHTYSTGDTITAALLNQAEADLAAAIPKADADAAYDAKGAATAAQAAAVQRVNHTGTQSADTLTDGTTNKAYTAAEKTKLAGVATGATANATDAALRDRSTHTGTQAASTVTGLSTVATSGAYTDLTAKPTIPAAYTDAQAVAANASALAGKAPQLVPTATKTAAYTAAVGDLAVMNVAGGATALTLPTAPADKSQVGFLAIGATTATPLTVNRGGSDTLGPSGATSVTAVLANEVTVYQYDAANTRWLAVGNVKPQAALDGRYAPRTREVFVDSYGADPTGAADSTTAFAAALAALPTVTVYGTATTPGKPGTAGSGTSATYPIGTLRLGVGTYQLGATSDLGNLGPFVNVLGPGHDGCTLDYRGSGDCLRAYNAVRPANDTFFNLNGMSGRFDGFTIAGENAAGPGAAALHIGDAEGWTVGPDLYIRNFAATGGIPVAALGASATTGGTYAAGTYYWKVTSLLGTTSTQESAPSNQITTTVALNGTQTVTWAAVPGAVGYKVYRANSTGQYYLAGSTSGNAATSFTDTGSTATVLTGWPTTSAGGTGLLLDNCYSWTENVRGWVTILNCANAIVLYAGNGTTTQNGFVGGDNSFMYCDLTAKLYCFEQQNGVVLANGATYQGGRLIVTANMKMNSAATTNALLTFTGQCPTGHLGSGTWSQIWNSELQLRAEVNGSGTGKPQTIKTGNIGNAVYGCFGILSFNGGATSWAPATYSLANTFANGTFQFAGQIGGDANLAPANGFQSTAALFYAPTQVFSSGNLASAVGDFAAYTLTANLAFGFGSGNKAGAQRKTVAFKQAASGGPFTVTWPKNASPTLTSPTVLWAGGTAPTMTTTAGAVDVYYLETLDGLTWWGRTTQAMS